MAIDNPSGDRFYDPRVRIYHFAEEVQVRCPSCGRRAVVLANLGEPERVRAAGGWLKTRRRLRCPGCGLCRDEFLDGAVFGGPVDPYFRLPLWLQVECCGGELLWAYNGQHLDLLESYVAAKLRERRQSPGSMSMLARLPAWMKSAKHRDEVLRRIRQLRASLESN
jgi:hypothetical protein